MADELVICNEADYREYSYEPWWSNRGQDGTRSWPSTYYGFNTCRISRYIGDTVEADSGRCCFRLKVNKDIVASLTGFSFQVICAASASAIRTLKYRVYTIDPTEYKTSIPSTPIATGTLTFNSTSKVIKTFTVNNISTSAEYIYVLFTLPTSNPENTSITLYEDDGSSIGEKTGVTSATFTENPISMTARYPQIATGSGYQYIDIANSGGRTLTIRLSCNQRLLAEVTAGSIASVYPDKSWFTTAGVTTLQSIEIVVSVKNHNGTTSFILTAGDDMKPTVDSVTTTCVQPAPASTHYPSTYLAGISKVKIEAAAARHSGAWINSVVAAISTGESVTLTYNSTTEKYEGTSAYPVADNFTVIVTATDERRMSGSRTSSSVAVTPYVRPAINIDLAGTIRCDDQGQETSGGAYYRAKATATVYTGLSGNQIVSFTVKEENAAAATAITSGTQSGVIQTGVAPANRMTIVFAVTDYVGYSSEKTYIFDGSRVWMMWETPASGNGLNIGIGKRPEIILNGISTVDVDVNNGTNAAVLGYLLEGINAGAFPMTADADLTGASFNKDFLNVDTSARIRKENAAEWFTKPSSDSTWSGFPTTMSGTEWRGLRVVFIIGSSSAMVMVLEAYPTPGRLWFRYKASSTWTSWYQLTPTT